MGRDHGRAGGEGRGAPAPRRRRPDAAGHRAQSRLARRPGASRCRCGGSTTRRSRWGSCTPADRTIRLSRRLQDMPAWVVDYVLRPRARPPARGGPQPALLGAGRPLPAGRAGQGLARRLLRRSAARGRCRRCRDDVDSRARARSISSTISVLEVGQGVDRPPPHVQRLVADPRSGARLRHRDVPHVEVVHGAARVAEVHGVPVEVQRLGVERAGPRAPTPRRPRAARSPASEASPGSW